ncbi:MAG: hypothetical protein WCI52_00830 [bacterium]
MKNTKHTSTITIIFRIIFYFVNYQKVKGNKPCRSAWIEAGL